jgi:hypothetical protein
MMSEPCTSDSQEIGARAAAALSAALGRTIRFAALHPLAGPKRRNFIARTLAIDEEGGTRPVVIKATRAPGYDATAANVLEGAGVAREWVATALVSARAWAREHGCALLAGDLATGTLVFEDLGADAASLVDPLLRGNAAMAEDALIRYATALARLHADTVNCLAAYREMGRAIFGSASQDRALGYSVGAEARDIVAKLGQAPPAEELQLLSSRLSDPGPWLALTHGDPCPDNALLVAGRMRLIDFEFARPSHALRDGLYWRIGFPTCWCAGRVPPDVAARIDAVYRAELARAIPAALDDRCYRTEQAYMAAVWLFTCLSWRLDAALDSDESWGTWSIRGRLLWYLEAVVAMTDAAGVLPGIAAAAGGWLRDLRNRWPDASPLGLYPAFAARSP